MFKDFNMPQMPFPFNMFNMNNAQNENGCSFPFSFGNMPQMPFQFGSMPQMPFQFGNMPQMPFPFNMFNTSAGGEEQKENSCPFPFQFGNMPQMPFQFGSMPQMPFPFGNMPQMPFPFNMFNTGNNEEKDGGQEDSAKQSACPFPFANMFKMPFPFNMNGNKAESGNNCVQVQGMNIPVELIQKALQLTASPKALEMLQKILDFLFEMYSKDPDEAPKEEPAE